MTFRQNVVGRLKGEDGFQLCIFQWEEGEDF